MLNTLSGTTRISVSKQLSRALQQHPATDTLKTGFATTRMSSSLATEIGAKHVTKGIGRMSDFVMKEGKGSWLIDDQGKKYLDFTTGIGVTSLGHCHPKVTEAAQKQCATLVHGQVNIGYHETYLKLIQRLLPKMPHPSLDSFFFWNSGSEAVEAAVKVARQATGRQNIIAMQGSYHGRTFGASSLTKSKTIYSSGTLPVMPGVFTSPFPYFRHMGLPSDTPISTLTASAIHQLHLVLAQQTTPKDTAAIIIEPELGEGGYIPAPKEFLEALREVCDKEGIMLIFDEVQSGYGRTGKMFSCEYSGVVPDILIMAKGIATGFPLSAIVSRKEIMDKMAVGSLGGTYSGNAVACAAALAVLDVFEQEKILDNVNARSKQLVSALESMRSSSLTGPLICDIRGQGLMIGIEFNTPPSSISLSASPNPTSTSDEKKDPLPTNVGSKVQKKCLEKGMLILTTSLFDTIRFIPALNITEEEMGKGIEIFREALKEVAEGK